MSQYLPVDDTYEARVRGSFARQAVMRTMGIEMTRVAPGEVDLRMSYRPELTQQHGFLHAGVLATALDSACGYAAFTLMNPDAAVLTIEFKLNCLAPAQGETFEFASQVIRAGKTILVCEARATAVQGVNRKLVASMTATIMAVTGKAGISQ